MVLQQATRNARATSAVANMVGVALVVHTAKLAVVVKPASVVVLASLHQRPLNPLIHLNPSEHRLTHVGPTTVVKSVPLATAVHSMDTVESPSHTARQAVSLASVNVTRLHHHPHSARLPAPLLARLHLHPSQRMADVEPITMARLAKDRHTETAVQSTTTVARLMITVKHLRAASPRLVHAREPAASSRLPAHRASLVPSQAPQKLQQALRVPAGHHLACRLLLLKLPHLSEPHRSSPLRQLPLLLLLLLPPLRLSRLRLPLVLR